MAVNQKVQNWLELAQRDLAFAKENLRKSNFRSYSPHFCHQALEKLLKALITAKTKTTPPYIHNLVRLAKLGKLDLDQAHQDILASLNPHYIGTKYPEDIAKMFKLYSQTKVNQIYNETHEAFQWLKKQLK